MGHLKMDNLAKVGGSEGLNWTVSTMMDCENGRFSNQRDCLLWMECRKIVLTWRGPGDGLKNNVFKTSELNNYCRDLRFWSFIYCFDQSIKMICYQKYLLFANRNLWFLVLTDISIWKSPLWLSWVVRGPSSSKRRVSTAQQRLLSSFNGMALKY